MPHQRWRCAAHAMSARPLHRVQRGCGAARTRRTGRRMPCTMPCAVVRGQCTRTRRSPPGEQGSEETVGEDHIPCRGGPHHVVRARCRRHQSGLSRCRRREAERGRRHHRAAYVSSGGGAVRSGLSAALASGPAVVRLGQDAQRRGEPRRPAAADCMPSSTSNITARCVRAMC